MIKMQRESSPRFLKHHSAPVKSVCFNPKERFQFASGGGDGKVSVCYVSVLVCQAAAITAFLPPFAPWNATVFLLTHCITLVICTLCLFISNSGCTATVILAREVKEKEKEKRRREAAQFKVRTWATSQPLTSETGWRGRDGYLACNSLRVNLGGNELNSLLFFVISCFTCCAGSKLLLTKCIQAGGIETRGKDAPGIVFVSPLVTQWRTVQAAVTDALTHFCAWKNGCEKNTPGQFARRTQGEKRMAHSEKGSFNWTQWLNNCHLPSCFLSFFSSLLSLSLFSSFGLLSCSFCCSFSSPRHLPFIAQLHTQWPFLCANESSIWPVLMSIIFKFPFFVSNGV